MFVRLRIVRWILVAAITVTSPSAGAAVQQVRREYVELHMGVGVRIVLYAADDATARRAARAAYARIARLEEIMSDYRPESEVRRLTATPGIDIRVSEHLFAVLARALELARLSDGAFDPTVGPYVELWRAARRSGRLPERTALDAAAARVGWRKVHLDSATRSVRVDVAGMRFDLGGIAKGYILDQARAALAEEDVTRVLLEGGGDITVGDPPPGLPGWRIEIPGAGECIRARSHALANATVSTSGDTEQFVIIAGVRYSHVVDPHTGLGLMTRRQATVVAPDGATADGLATALTVLNEEQHAALLRAFPNVVADVRSAGNALRSRRCLSD